MRQTGGRALFLRADTGCAGCHIPPRYTDSVLTSDPADYVLHDVGTLSATSGMRLGGPLPGIDTPTLKGIWATPPYLHDGSAPTVIDVLVTRNRDDRHGRTSHLSPTEIDDLAEFLHSLDDEAASAPPPPYRRGDSNCDGRVNISDPIHSLDWLFLGEPSPCCLRAADANNDRRNDLSDALFTLTWLFLDGPQPLPPGPSACGVDGDPAPGLECASYPEGRC